MVKVLPRVQSSRTSEVLGSCRLALWAVGGISGVVNLLTLTGSLFMMQVYDRVLSSQSIPTLFALFAIAAAAYVFQGLLDAVRTRILALVGERVDEDLGPLVHEAITDLPLRIPLRGQETLQPIRDLDTLRGFIGSAGPIALFDIPWVPIYLAVLFLLHPWLGWLTILGTGVLIALTYLAEIRTKAPAKVAADAASLRNLMTDQVQRNAEVVRAMGMRPALRERWQRTHDAHIAAQRASAFLASALSGLSKSFRMILQSAILGLGAYLVIKGQMSGGAIIAGTILSGRAMAPIDQVIGSWRGFVACRQAHARLEQVLALYPERASAFPLPPPKSSLILENVALVPPGGKAPVVRRATLSLKSGQALGLIGPSASGKSSLLRGIVGLWPLAAGRISLDGSSLDQWSPDALGPCIGYLPQDVQLFDGTVAENIARFAATPAPGAVIAAAQAAGFHTHVVEFADGYDTRIGDRGMHLSAGQRQRLGLARALYNDPFLVVLDEPNSNLDAEGEAAVARAIAAVRARGGIAIVVAHRPSAIASVDMLAAMKGGDIIAVGERDEVLAKVLQGPRNNIVPHPAATPGPSRNLPSEGPA